MERKGQDEDNGTPKESRKRRRTPSEPTTTAAKASREDESSDVSSRRQHGEGTSAQATTSSADADDTGEEGMDQGLEGPGEEPATSGRTTPPLDLESVQTPMTSTSEVPSATCTDTSAPPVAADTPSTSSSDDGGHQSRVAPIAQFRQPSTESASSDSSSLVMASGTDDEADTMAEPQEGSIPAHAIELGRLTLDPQDQAGTSSAQEHSSLAMAAGTDDEADTPVIPRQGSIPAPAAELGGLILDPHNQAGTSHGRERFGFEESALDTRLKKASRAFDNCMETVKDILKKLAHCLLDKKDVIPGTSGVSQPYGSTEAPGNQLSPTRPGPSKMAAADTPDAAPTHSAQKMATPLRPSFLRLTSDACASTSGAVSQPSGRSAGPSQPRSPPLPGSSSDSDLEELSQFLHKKQPELFPQPEAAIMHMLSFVFPGGTPPTDSPNDTLAEVPLDAICTHTDETDCWLLQCQQVLNRALFPFGMEIAQLHMRTCTLRHVGEDPTKVEPPEDPLVLTTPDTRTQVKRRDFVRWLLRFHRCIASLRLNLLAVTPLPREFCDGWQLHGGYVAIQLGVKSDRAGREVPRWRGPPKRELPEEPYDDGDDEEGPLGDSLFRFLENVSLLTELSFFGLFFSQKSDQIALPRLVSANRRLRKLSFEQCHIVNRNMAALIEAVMMLPSLEEFSLSLRNEGYAQTRGEHLMQLILRPSQLKKLCLDADASFVPLVQSLASNTSVTDLHIKTLVNLDIFDSLHHFSTQNSLRRLTLNVDFSSIDNNEEGRRCLVEFLRKTRLECLTFETPSMPVEAAIAIAAGVERNGAPAEAGEGGQFLQNFRIKCSTELLRHHQLALLVQALDVNKKIRAIDVGIAVPVDEDELHGVTEDVLKFTKARIPTHSPGHTASGKVQFPLVKAYFPAELEPLIDALRHGMYFHKHTNVFLCFPGSELSENRIADFRRFLALLPYYDTRVEMTSLTVNVPFVDVPHALGLSTLCCMSPCLTELSVNYGENCSAISSILLFEGVARSKSIRKLTASGCCLKQPVPKWFEYMCKESTTLQDLHIHVYNLSDEAAHEFVGLLPTALRTCLSPIFRIKLTRGAGEKKVHPPEAVDITGMNHVLIDMVGEEIDVYLPEVLEIVRMNQRLPAEAVRFLVDIERFRRKNEHRKKMPAYPVEILNTQRAKVFCLARHMPGFLDYVRDSTSWSTEKVVSELEKARELITENFFRLTNVCQEIRAAQGSTDGSLQFAHIPHEMHMTIFRMLEIQDVRVERNERPVDGVYEENVGNLEVTMSAIFEQERDIQNSIAQDRQL